MRTSRRTPLQLESIESRCLLSSVTPVTRAAEISPMIYPPPVLLTGEVRGTALVRRNIPDVGDMYTLRGSGRVGPLGQVNVQGSIQTTSFSGQPIGTLTLSNRYGVVEIQITGRPAVTGNDAPGEFNFRVTRATGAYAKLNGTGGVLDLAVGRPGPLGRATFRMEINPVVIL